MRLLRNNWEMWNADEETILNEFVRSDLFKRPMDEKIKLVLFISYEPPRGLGSTFVSGKEFNRLFDVYTMKKGELLG